MTIIVAQSRAQCHKMYLPFVRVGANVERKCFYPIQFHFLHHSSLKKLLLVMVMMIVMTMIRTTIIMFTAANWLGHRESPWAGCNKASAAVVSWDGWFGVNFCMLFVFPFKDTDKGREKVRACLNNDSIQLAWILTKTLPLAPTCWLSSGQCVTDVWLCKPI